MSKQVKNGKIPVSSREAIDAADLFDEVSILDVDPIIKKHLADKEMTVRWINATEFRKSGGFNGKGWSPVRTSDIPKETLASSSMMFGATAEGFIVRNDLMLACRSKAMTDKHERQLKAKAALASGKSKQHADGIRDNLGRYGRVIEGYDENSED